MKENQRVPKKIASFYLTVAFITTMILEYTGTSSYIWEWKYRYVDAATRHRCYRSHLTWQKLLKTIETTITIIIKVFYRWKPVSIKLYVSDYSDA